MSVITEMYREMGIRNSVVNLGKEIEATLKERFDTIDEIAEYNQVKTRSRYAEKSCRRAACFEYASGYGYDDLGRDKLEKVYADVLPYGRVRWFVHRSPAERMHWRWLCQPISVRGMNWYPWPASHTIHWKK